MTLVLLPLHGWPNSHVRFPLLLHAQATQNVHMRAGVRRQRNKAYDSAIRAAVAYRRGIGVQRITALDIGAGSGLLSMMALRFAGPGICAMPALPIAGTAIEASKHSPAHQRPQLPGRQRRTMSTLFTAANDNKCA